MKIRGLLAGLLCAVVLGGCARSATAPEAPAAPIIRASFDETPPPPPPSDTTSRGGGAMGNGH
jgi:hypothetical protein